VKEADIQHVIDSHAAEITEKDLEQLCRLSEPEYDEDSDNVVERLQTITSTLKKKASRWRIN
jgi:hypothetical protein